MTNKIHCFPQVNNLLTLIQATQSQSDKTLVAWRCSEAYLSCMRICASIQMKCHICALSKVVKRDSNRKEIRDSTWNLFTQILEKKKHQFIVQKSWNIYTPGKKHGLFLDILIDYYKHILCLIKCLFTLSIEINLVILFLNDLYPIV